MYMIVYIICLFGCFKNALIGQRLDFAERIQALLHGFGVQRLNQCIYIHCEKSFLSGA